jgi:hypothetical protein
MTRDDVPPGAAIESTYVIVTSNLKRSDPPIDSRPIDRLCI